MFLSVQSQRSNYFSIGGGYSPMPTSYRMPRACEPHTVYSNKRNTDPRPDPRRSDQGTSQHRFGAQYCITLASVVSRSAVLLSTPFMSQFQQNVFFRAQS